MTSTKSAAVSTDVFAIVEYDRSRDLPASAAATDSPSALARPLGDPKHRCDGVRDSGGRR